MDAIAKEMKKKLETMNEEINSLTKQERKSFDSQQIITTFTDFENWLTDNIDKR